MLISVGKNKMNPFIMQATCVKKKKERMFNERKAGTVRLIDMYLPLNELIRLFFFRDCAF